MMVRILRLLLLLVLAVLLLLMVKAVTVGLALIELDDAVNDLLYMPKSAEAFGEKTQHTMSAVGRIAAELQVFTPVLPLLGSDGCALSDTIMSASEISAAGQVLNVLAPAAFESYNQSSEISIYIDTLRERWATLDQQAVTKILAPRHARNKCLASNRRLQEWQEAVEGAHFVLETFASIPWEQVLADETSTLIVLNNSDELRATGGFTTALIVVEIEDGYLNWRLMNSYSVDDPERYEYHPPAPLPQQRYMALSKWTFRDANWSPDHREAAQVALQLYALDQNKPRPQTLITLNFTALRTLMSYSPPVEVNGKTLNAENVMDFIREAWGFDSSLSWFDPNRKDFLQDVGYELAEAMVNSLTPIEQARIGLALRDMLERRDVMVYSSVPQLADWLAQQGWDGALTARSGDFLTVIDTNLGYNKMSAYTNKTIRYWIDLRREPQAVLTLSYQNNVKSNMDCTEYTKSREQVEAEGREPTYYDRAVNCYWNYIRVLVPAQSRILDYQAWAAPPEWFPFTRVENTAQIDALEVGGYAGFGTMLVIPPGETREVSFDYALPFDVIMEQDARHYYQLFVQKQPSALAANLSVKITLPEGARILAPAPDDTISIYANHIVIEHTFETDTLIEVVYE